MVWGGCAAERALLLNTTIHLLGGRLSRFDQKHNKKGFALSQGLEVEEVVGEGGQQEEEEEGGGACVVS